MLNKKDSLLAWIGLSSIPGIGRVTKGLAKQLPGKYFVRQD